MRPNVLATLSFCSSKSVSSASNAPRSSLRVLSGRSCRDKHHTSAAIAPAVPTIPSTRLSTPRVVTLWTQNVKFFLDGEGRIPLLLLVRWGLENSGRRDRITSYSTRGRQFRTLRVIFALLWRQSGGQRSIVNSRT